MDIPPQPCTPEPVLQQGAYMNAADSPFTDLACPTSHLTVHVVPSEWWGIHEEDAQYDQAAENAATEAQEQGFSPQELGADQMMEEQGDMANAVSLAQSDVSLDDDLFNIGSDILAEVELLTPETIHVSSDDRAPGGGYPRQNRRLDELSNFTQRPTVTQHPILDGVQEEIQKAAALNTSELTKWMQAYEEVVLTLAAIPKDKWSAYLGRGEAVEWAQAAS